MELVNALPERNHVRSIIFLNQTLMDRVSLIHRCLIHVFLTYRILSWSCAAFKSWVLQCTHLLKLMELEGHLTKAPRFPLALAINSSHYLQKRGLEASRSWQRWQRLRSAVTRCCGSSCVGLRLRRPLQCPAWAAEAAAA